MIFIDSGTINKIKNTEENDMGILPFLKDETRIMVSPWIGKEEEL